MQSIQYEEWTMTENTDVNANFLNADWWKTATIEDVKAEMAKGADVRQMNNKTLDAALIRVQLLMSEIKDVIDDISNFSHIVDEQMKEIEELDDKIEELTCDLEKIENQIQEKDIALSAYY